MFRDDKLYTFQILFFPLRVLWAFEQLQYLALNISKVIDQLCVKVKHSLHIIMTSPFTITDLSLVE